MKLSADDVMEVLKWLDRDNVEACLLLSRKWLELICDVSYLLPLRSIVCATLHYSATKRTFEIVIRLRWPGDCDPNEWVHDDFCK